MWSHRFIEFRHSLRIAHRRNLIVHVEYLSILVVALKRNFAFFIEGFGGSDVKEQVIDVYGVAVAKLAFIKERYCMDVRIGFNLE